MISADVQVARGMEAPGSVDECAPFTLSLFIWSTSAAAFEFSSYLLASKSKGGGGEEKHNKQLKATHQPKAETHYSHFQYLSRSFK